LQSEDCLKYRKIKLRFGKKNLTEEY